MDTVCHDRTPESTWNCGPITEILTKLMLHPDSLLQQDPKYHNKWDFQVGIKKYTRKPTYKQKLYW